MGSKGDTLAIIKLDVGVHLEGGDSAPLWVKDVHGVAHDPVAPKVTDAHIHPACSPDTVK